RHDSFTTLGESVHVVHPHSANSHAGDVQRVTGRLVAASQDVTGNNGRRDGEGGGCLGRVRYKFAASEPRFPGRGHGDAGEEERRTRFDGHYPTPRRITQGELPSPLTHPRCGHKVPIQSLCSRGDLPAYCSHVKELAKKLRPGTAPGPFFSTDFSFRPAPECHWSSMRPAVHTATRASFMCAHAPMTSAATRRLGRVARAT